MARRKLVKVEVTLSVASHLLASEARRELRTRVNELCCWSADETDVRVRKMRGVR